VKNDPTFWLLARASGMTAYGLLTGSILAGLVLKSKPFGGALKPAPTMDVHRFLALLGLGMLTLHGATLLLDRTLHMPLAGLFVPGASPYRPASVAVGVVAAELMALIYVSFFLRKRIGPRNWPRLRLGNGLDAAVGARPLPGGGRRRRLRHGVAGARPSHPPCT